MTKIQLEQIVAQFLNAAPVIIVAARQHTLDRSCMVCGAGQGEQHSESCALWGLVAGRIDFHRLSDPRPKANGVEPATYVETMTALEAGTVSTQTAPELEFARKAFVAELKERGRL